MNVVNLNLAVMHVTLLPLSYYNPLSRSGSIAHILRKRGRKNGHSRFFSLSSPLLNLEEAPHNIQLTMETF